MTALNAIDFTQSAFLVIFYFKNIISVNKPSRLIDSQFIICVAKRDSLSIIGLKIQ